MPRRHATTVRVRYAETDRMGVVYHTNYLVWCEIGRTELIRGLGTSYASLEAEGIRLAVAEASIRFHSPARYDDRVRIETWIERAQSRAVTFGYEIARVEPEPETRLATARTMLVALDTDGEPRRLPDGVVRLFRPSGAG